MSPKSISSNRTGRTFAFTISDSPRKSRIKSFLDDAWDMNFPSVQLVCNFDTSEIGSERTTHVGRQISHRRAISSVDSRPFSPTVFDDEDTISEYLDIEPPSIETARLQYHRAVPVRKLVYTSRSHATSTFSSHGASFSRASRYSTEWSKELSSLFEYTWRRSRNGQATPIRPHTAHTTSTTRLQTPSADSIGSYPFPSPPETPSKLPRYNHRPDESIATVILGNSQSSTPSPRREDLWLCQYSPANAARIRPMGNHGYHSRGTVNRPSPTRLATRGDLMERPIPEASSPAAVLFHLPFTPKKESAEEYHSEKPFERDTPQPPEIAQSVKWSPCSAADTLVEDNDFVFENKENHKPSDGGRDRFSRLWRKLFCKGRSSYINR